MFGRHKAVTISISAALIAATLTATGATAQLGKGGGAVPPVALELAVAEWAGSGLVDTFAAKVEELSGGQMRIDIDWEGGPEQVVPARVRDGEADLGWVFARGLNASGVHDLDALLTPFLVSDGSLLTAIITGQIGSEMLAGLTDDGLEGLALLPGNQRFFVGIGHPLAAPADFDGARIALTGTPFTDRFVESLGAEPVEIELDDRAAYEEQGIDGLLTVASNLGLFPDTYMTANLVPYTVPVIVLANAAAMAELTPEQQDVLRTAAIEVRDQMLDEMPSVESAAVRCGTGGAVIQASDADVLAVEAGTRPVRDWLATDAATAGFIERIEALKAESPPPAWPATCGTLPPVGTSLAGIPDGTYRAVGTRQDSLRTGWASDCDLELVDEHLALVVENSGASWSMLVACGDSPLETGAAGTYEYSDAGDQFTVLEPGYPRGQTFAWSLDDGALTLTMVEPGGASEEDVAAGKFLFERTFTMDSPDEVLGRIPDGTYTTEVTEADAVRTGWKDICTLNGQVKTVTLVIEGERFTELQSCDDGPAEIGSEGTFEYTADHLIVREPGSSGGPTFAWSVDGETLSLQVVDPYDEGELGVLQFLFEHDFARTST